jgi:hypothetical protein
MEELVGISSVCDASAERWRLAGEDIVGHEVIVLGPAKAARQGAENSNDSAGAVY